MTRQNRQLAREAQYREDAESARASGQMARDAEGGVAAQSRPSRRGFLAGLWAAIPVLLAVAPFGLIFGTLASEAGLAPGQVMAFTSLVIAGAAQLASLQVLGDGAPLAIALLTGAVVNLRMAMYSAALAVEWQDVPLLWRVPAAFFLNDQAFALSMRRYALRPGEPMSDRLGFFFGVGMLTSGVWIAATLVGIEIGGRLPDGWGLDFAVPATFLSLVAPMIRGTANLVAAVVSASVAVGLAWLPFGTGLIVGSVSGIAVGMIVSRKIRRRHGEGRQ